MLAGEAANHGLLFRGKFQLDGFRSVRHASLRV
jgi:hypothetical protein